MPRCPCHASHRLSCPVFITRHDRRNLCKPTNVRTLAAIQSNANIGTPTYTNCRYKYTLGGALVATFLLARTKFRLRIFKSRNEENP